MTTVSMNAVTHGLFSQEAVLTTHGEDPQEYAQFLDELTCDLRPQNVLEHHCVQTIAASFWRLRRFHRWEAARIPDPTLTPDEQFQKMERAQRAEAGLHRRINTALKQLGRDLPELLQSRSRLPSPTVASDKGSSSDTQNCQNEPCAASILTPPLLGAGGPPNLPLRGAPAEQGREISSPAADSQNCQNEPPLLLSSEGRLAAGHPDVGFQPASSRSASPPADTGSRRAQLTLLRAQRKAAKGLHRV